MSKKTSNNSLSIKNITSNRKNDNWADIKSWNNKLIIKLLKYYNRYNPECELIVCDEMVDNYNRETQGHKSDKNFIIQVNKLIENRIIIEEDLVEEKEV